MVQGRGGAEDCPERRAGLRSLSLPPWIDPADISVRAAIYDIGPPIGSATKHNDLGVGRIELHRSSGNGHLPDPRRWLGDNRRMESERFALLRPGLVAMSAGSLFAQKLF